MIQCNLYLTLSAPEQLIRLIRDRLPEHELSGSLDEGMLFAVKGSETIRFHCIHPSFLGDDFANMMNGIHHYFSSINTEHKETQKTLLAQLEIINAAVSVQVPDGAEALDNATFSTVAAIASDAEGLVFLSHGGLYTGDGTLILDAEGNSDVDEYKVHAPAEILDRHIEVTSSGIARKKRSHAILREMAVPVNENLPPIVGDEHVQLRSPKEIAERATAIIVTAVYGEFLRDNDVEYAQEFGHSIIDSYGAWPFLSPEEKHFVQNKSPDVEDAYPFIWRYECYWAALWVLGFVKDMGVPDSICDVRAMTGYLREAGSADVFAAQAKMRSASEILDETDLVYRMNWACVDANINGRDAPADLNPSVVVERHRFLNWVIRYLDLDWDHVRTDT